MSLQSCQNRLPEELLRVIIDYAYNRRFVSYPKKDWFNLPGLSLQQKNVLRAQGYEGNDYEWCNMELVNLSLMLAKAPQVDNYPEEPLWE